MRAAILAVAVILSVSAHATAGTDVDGSVGHVRVDVCHVTGEADFGSGPMPVGHVLTIAEPAYDAHVAHGDPTSFGLLDWRDGCAIDSDADGIPDAIDQCPDQGDLGNGVDPDGCPLPGPELSVEGSCVSDLAFPRFVISNAGGPMNDPETYEVTYEDGTTATGDFLLSAGESTNLDLSNLHGWITFGIVGHPDLTTMVENCLDAAIQQALQQGLWDYLENSIPSGPFFSFSGWDFYWDPTAASFQTVLVASQSVAGWGYQTDAVVVDLTLGFTADCTNLDCLLLGGDTSGTVYIDSITQAGDWTWDAGLQNVSVTNATTTLDGFAIEMDNGWADFLVQILLPFIEGGLVADLEADLQILFVDLMQDSIAPLLVE